VIQGSNMAECHPVGFQWVMEAKRRGATVIHVDPRFTRTSAVSDLHVPIRAGTDIAFLGGLVNHVISTGSYFRDYVVHYTNAAVLVSEDFRDTEDLDGLFSGWDPETGQYDPTSWRYAGDITVEPAAGQREQFAGEPETQRGQEVHEIERDETLEDPRCVFQVLKRHFARYTPEVVAEICGIDPDQFRAVAGALCENSGPERTSAFCYAVGWTQHSKGVQYIRTASILQLLLGNIGRPGGGILALRGHASIQGSTDIPTLYNILPGYLPMPKARYNDTFEDYVANNQSGAGWWSQFDKYTVSLLKAWFGEAATEENGWCFDHLPRLSGDHSHMTTVAAMADGDLEGYLVMGENPVVGSMHGALHRKGLRELDWLVVRDFVPTETAEFWKVAPEIDRGEVRPQDIQTEVFFFPCAAHTEKEGTFTNTQRLLQWKEQAIEPPGDCRSELWFTYHLGRRLKELYAGSGDPKDRPIQDLRWEYPTHRWYDEPDAEAVLEEISGYHTGTGEPVAGFSQLEADGSTACGCWIYSGCYRDGVNQPNRRKPGADQSWVAPEWGWAWPDNRRLLYNRASADPEGRPWSERKRYVWWDEESARWVGEDVPDFPTTTEPGYRHPEDARGIETINGDDPFIMQTDGKGWLYVPTGLLDGPMPTHYEPQESVLDNPLYAQKVNPARLEWNRRDNPYHRPVNDPGFPFVLTTYRLTEHHTAGAMSRWVAWLSELMPQLFCEVSPELALVRRLENGGWATIRTARGEIECRVLVTERIRPLRLGKRRDRVVHQIGLPYHWGTHGLVTGDVVNELIGFVADPNVSIQESKALTCDIQPGRRSRKRRAVTSGALGGSTEDPSVGRDTAVVAGTKAQTRHGLRSGQAQQFEEFARLPAEPDAGDAAAGDDDVGESGPAPDGGAT
jgi:formate dehydrogenase major subunit